MAGGGDASGAPLVGGDYFGVIDFGNGPLPMGNGAAFIAKLTP